MVMTSKTAARSPATTSPSAASALWNTRVTEATAKKIHERRCCDAIAVVVLVLASVPTDAVAKSKPARSTVDPALLQDALANPNKTFAVIVQSVPDARKAGRADRAGAAVKRNGGASKHALPIIGAA